MNPLKTEEAAFSNGKDPIVASHQVRVSTENNFQSTLSSSPEKLKFSPDTEVKREIKPRIISEEEIKDSSSVKATTPMAG